jgi:hypothetical protein
MNEEEMEGLRTLTDKLLAAMKREEIARNQRYIAYKALLKKAIYDLKKVSNG